MLLRQKIYSGIFLEQVGDWLVLILVKSVTIETLTR